VDFKPKRCGFDRLRCFQPGLVHDLARYAERDLYPTIDRPQTRDMELMFSDGETFVHEDKRDIEYDFKYIDCCAPAVRVVGTDCEKRYTVTKEFIADPHHPVVLMNVKITGDEAVLSRLKCYALLAPHLNVGGAGNSARSIDVAGDRCLLAWKGETSLAMGADCGFTRSSSGYVGAAMATRIS